MSLPRYTMCKDSGVEWLGEVPSDWDVRRISDQEENCGRRGLCWPTSRVPIIQGWRNENSINELGKCSCELVSVLRGILFSEPVSMFLQDLSK